MAFCPVQSGRTAFLERSLQILMILRLAWFVERRMQIVRQRRRPAADPPGEQAAAPEAVGKSETGPAHPQIRHPGRMTIVCFLDAQTSGFHPILTIALHEPHTRKEGALNESAMLA